MLKHVSYHSLLALSLVYGLFAGSTLQAESPSVAAQQVDTLLSAEVYASEVGEASTAPAGQADDETFLRRATLDVTGRLPLPEEVAAFSLDPSPTKRADMVERLLASPEYGDNWGRYWRDAILYRRTEDRALQMAPVLENYLTDRFNSGAGWDQIAREFITATGNVREEGSTGIFMSQMAETADVAAEVSRLFMGIQIQCAQCHDHKTDKWKRTQFHEFAAFFPRVEVRNIKGVQPQSFEVVAVDQGPKNPKAANRRRASREHYMPDLDNPTARGTLMQPVFFVSGQKLPVGASDQERRDTLAQWITDPSNPWFAKAFVNRIWSELVGEGFYEPVEDIGPERDCWAPQTLDYLAQQFVASGHDVRWLLSTIMATDVYQRESRSRRTLKEKPFLASCQQRLRADQLFDALSLALDFQDMPGAQGGNGKRAAQRNPRFRFSEAFGYDPSISREEVAGSIPQALLMMNSPDINRAIKVQPATPRGLSKLLAETNDNRAVVLELYLRTLAREPSTDEVQTCLDHVKQSPGRAAGFEDILWSLVNSTEFLHRK